MGRGIEGYRKILFVIYFIVFVGIVDCLFVRNMVRVSDVVFGVLVLKLGLFCEVGLGVCLGEGVMGTYSR